MSAVKHVAFILLAFAVILFFIEWFATGDIWPLIKGWVCGMVLWGLYSFHKKHGITRHSRERREVRDWHRGNR